MDSTDYQNGPDTPDKQQSLRLILEKTMAIIGQARINHPDWATAFPPIYFDLFAGPGCTDEGAPGSPLLFLEIAGRQRYPWLAHFYERRESTSLKLLASLDNVEHPGNVSYCIHRCDNQFVTEVLPSKPIDHRKWGKQLGIAYSDPSNADLHAACFPLRAIAIAYRGVDLIFNYAAASWKRQIALERYRELREFLAEIPKQRWLIRKPLDKWQWTMLFGTNFLRYGPEKRGNWFPIDTPEGRYWFEQANKTRKQRGDDNQLPLFGDN